MAYKIISFDGGGSCGQSLRQWRLASFTVTLTPGQKILARFDLAVSNSGGSIILGGLASNFSPQDLIDFFNNEPKRKTISLRIWSTPSGWNATKLHPNSLRWKLCLEQAARRLNLSNPPCKLLICTFDYNRGRAQFFRSDTNFGGYCKREPSANARREAVHTSTNAPVKLLRRAR